MRHFGRSLVAMSLLSMIVPAQTFGQSSAAFQREEDRRNRIDAQQNEKTKEVEAWRATNILVEDIKRDNRWWSQQGTETRPNSNLGSGSSFVDVAIGIATIGITAAVLDQIFVANRQEKGVRPPAQWTVDPSTEKWLQDPFNNPGETVRYDTPDGKISKVCFEAGPEEQLAIYRWDAPNEVARVVEIRRPPNWEHIQLVHPSANGLFIYVTKPVRDHKPSDRIYYLAAHRIDKTGCGHAEAYRVHYPEYAGPPVMERYAERMRNNEQRAKARDEETSKKLIFKRTCEAHHNEKACFCLAYHLVIATGNRDVQSRQYAPKEYVTALRAGTGIPMQVERLCGVRLPY